MQLRFLAVVLMFASANPLIASAEAPHRDVYVLKSSGVCDGCAEAISQMLFTAGIHSQILGPSELKGAVKENDVLIIGGGIPGGEGEWTIKQDLMKAQAFGWLKRFIAGGGHYIGICAGAYLAEEWIDEKNAIHGLNIFPGKIDNYSHQDKAAKVLLTEWKSAANPHRYVYFQDGPAFYPAAGADLTVLGSFAEDHTAAAVTFPYGRGQVLLLSPHLEASREWTKGDHLRDPDGIDYDLGIELMRPLIAIKGEN